MSGWVHVIRNVQVWVTVRIGVGWAERKGYREEMHAYVHTDDKDCVIRDEHQTKRENACVAVCVCVRERERETDTHTHTYIHTHTHTHTMSSSQYRTLCTAISFFTATASKRCRSSIFTATNSALSDVGEKEECPRPNLTLEGDETRDHGQRMSVKGDGMSTSTHEEAWISG